MRLVQKILTLVLYGGHSGTIAPVLLSILWSNLISNVASSWLLITHAPTPKSRTKTVIKLIPYSLFICCVNSHSIDFMFKYLVFQLFLFVRHNIFLYNPFSSYQRRIEVSRRECNMHKSHRPNVTVNDSKTFPVHAETSDNAILYQ